MNFIIGYFHLPLSSFFSDSSSFVPLLFFRQLNVLHTLGRPLHQSSCWTQVLALFLTLYWWHNPVGQRRSHTVSLHSRASRYQAVFGFCHIELLVGFEPLRFRLNQVPFEANYARQIINWGQCLKLLSPAQVGHRHRRHCLQSALPQALTRVVLILIVVMHSLNCFPYSIYVYTRWWLLFHLRPQPYSLFSLLQWWRW